VKRWWWSVKPNGLIKYFVVFPNKIYFPDARNSSRTRHGPALFFFGLIIALLLAEAGLQGLKNIDK
jgi:hypothetical protein